MSVESEGTGGGRPGPAVGKSAGTTPRNYDISVSFFLAHESFAFSNIFKIKWPKSEEKLNFGGRLALVPMNSSKSEFGSIPKNSVLNPWSFQFWG